MFNHKGINYHCVLIIEAIILTLRIIAIEKVGIYRFLEFQCHTLDLNIALRRKRNKIVFEASIECEFVDDQVCAFPNSKERPFSIEHTLCVKLQYLSPIRGPAIYDM